MTVSYVSRRVSPSLDVCASRQLTGTGTVGFLAPSRARFRGSSAEYFARAVLGVKLKVRVFDALECAAPSCSLPLCFRWL